MAAQIVLLHQAVWSGMNGEIITTYPRPGVDGVFLAMQTFKHTTGTVVALEKNEKGQVVGVVCAAIYCATVPFDPEELLVLAAAEFKREPHLNAAITGKNISLRSLLFADFELSHPFNEDEFSALYVEIYMKYAVAGQA
mgnify:CR=1 FL=1